jgi:hypothetical protein
MYRDLCNRFGIGDDMYTIKRKEQVKWGVFWLKAKKK